MGWASVKLGASLVVIQMSAEEWSIGSEMYTSKPSNKPPCIAISVVLKVTASTAGIYRLRLRQSIAREYGSDGLDMTLSALSFYLA
jgi:hypothetical protein